MRDLDAGLDTRRARNLYRARRVAACAQGPEMVLDGHTVWAFCSNDYLGLASDHRVIEAMAAGARRWGVGAGAAHLVGGHMEPHHALEDELAAHTGRERALLFSTGYMANLGIGSALLHRGDAVFADRLDHASLIDAGYRPGVHFERYRHGDVADLERRLASSRAGERLVLTDGVFSMDGDIAPLAGIATACRRHGARLVVDDAHGLGVVGAGGGGSVAAAGLGAEDVPVLMATLGKALGTAGAFVAGDAALIETLIQSARTYVYTTALPPAVAEATRTALAIAAADEERRARLAALVRRFREGVDGVDASLMASATPIQPLVVGTAERALAVSAGLLEEGLLVVAIRPPTVPAGTARLRVTLSAAHDEAQVDRLVDALWRHLGPR